MKSKEILKENISEKDLLVYHGTNEEFNEFDDSQHLLWFTKDKSYAKNFGNKVLKCKIEFNNGVDIGEVDGYLDELDDEDFNEDDEVNITKKTTVMINGEKFFIPYRMFRLSKDTGIDVKILMKTFVDVTNDYDYDDEYEINFISNDLAWFTNSYAFKDLIVKAGYDCVIANESGRITYGVISKNQVQMNVNEDSLKEWHFEGAEDEEIQGVTLTDDLYSLKDMFKTYCYRCCYDITENVVGYSEYDINIHDDIEEFMSHYSDSKMNLIRLISFDKKDGWTKEDINDEIDYAGFDITVYEYREFFVVTLDRKIDFEHTGFGEVLGTPISVNSYVKEELKESNDWTTTVYTYQSQEVIDKLNKGQTYYAEYGKGMFSTSDAYQELSRVLGLKHCPIFGAIDEDELYDMMVASGLETSNRTHLLTLEVPSDEVHKMAYYDWTEYIYYWIDKQEDDSISKEEAENYLKYYSGDGPCQVVIDRIEPKWIVKKEDVSSENPFSKEEIEKDLDDIHNWIMSKKNESIENSVEVDNLGNELSKEQSEFFKNSTVRKDNKLVVCYHGTGREFGDLEFKSSINWFSEVKDYSKEFSDFWGGKDKGYTYVVYLNCKNTFDCGATDGKVFGLVPIKPYKFSPRFDEILNDLELTEEEKRKLIKDVVDERINDGYVDEEERNSYEYTLRIHVATRTRAFKNLVMSKGYDSIKTIEAGNTCYGVFNSKDIKLVTNKKPTNSVKMNESINKSDAKLNDKVVLNTVDAMRKLKGGIK